MTDINDKLDIIIIKIETLEQRIDKLENKTNDIHQFVPFVGFLNNVTKKIFTLPKLNWLTNNIEIEEDDDYLFNETEEINESDSK